MQTLSFILVAAPLSFIFGLGLGIAAYKSKRVEKALYPILLVMQTMPQYAVLVPALVLFGVGDHAAVIITMVVAVPPMILLTILGLRAIPPEVIGCTKVFHFDGSNTITNNMFSVKYQLFLNDIYYWGATELLTYAMTKTYLEDINFLLTTEKQIRFNQRQDRLYLDIDWSSMTEGDYLIIDCWRAMNPNDYTRVWNDSFLKPYTVALIKRQWGQNLIKFAGVKLPGGTELNGRQIYDDAEKELTRIREIMSNTYELPPLDMIG